MLASHVRVEDLDDLLFLAGRLCFTRRALQLQENLDASDAATKERCSLEASNLRGPCRFGTMARLSKASAVVTADRSRRAKRRSLASWPGVHEVRNFTGLQ